MIRHHPSITIARFVVIEAMRNRLFSLMLISVIGILGLSEFAGGLAQTESDAVGGSLYACCTRLAAVFMFSLFVITCIVREFNEKTIEIMLALPAPRYVWFIGKLCGYLLLAVFMAGVSALPLLLYAMPVQALAWGVSLFCELAIVASLCLFFLFTLGQVTAALCAVAAFYLLARIMGSMQLISHSPLLDTGATTQEVIRNLLDFIAVLLPDLDKFTRTDWIVYGGGMQDLPAIIVQTVIYVGLLAAAALFDFYRKNL